MARSGAVGAREGVGLEPETTEQTPGPGTDGATILAVVVSLGIHAAVLVLAWPPTPARDGPCIESCCPGNPYVEMMLRGPSPPRTERAPWTRPVRHESADESENQVERFPFDGGLLPYLTPVVVTLSRPCTEFQGVGPFDGRDHLIGSGSGTLGGSDGLPTLAPWVGDLGSGTCSFDGFNAGWLGGGTWYGSFSVEPRRSCSGGGSRIEHCRTRRGAAPRSGAPTATEEGSVVPGPPDAGTRTDVRIDELRAVGPLSVQLVQRVLRMHRGRLGHCREQALRSGADVGDRATVLITVAPEGTVRFADAAIVRPVEPLVEECIEAVLRRVAFPSGDSSTNVTCSILFVPTGEPTPGPSGR